MLSRRKLLLSLIAQRQEAIAVSVLHLLLALVAEREEKPSYFFIPTAAGPYSIDVQHDLHSFEKGGELVIEDGSVRLQRDRVNPLSYALDGSTLALLLDSLSDFGSKGERALMDLAIGQKPFYGIYTTRSDSAIEHVREAIASAKRGVYTLGYEGLSIDQFIICLIVNDIRTTVDVREYAFSRRAEFSKANLVEALAQANITYIGMPEVGIPTKARKEILEHKSKEELLAYYEDEIVATTGASAARLAELASVANTALICHEEDPQTCHRSHFAAFALQREPSIAAIYDIRTKDGCTYPW